MEYIFEKFPELEKINDEDLKNKTAETFAEAMRRGGWDNLDGIPFTLIVDTMGEDMVAHVRAVTKLAIAVAEARDDLDMDLIVAGAILHDVGKLLEYERKDGKVVKSANGVILRHPVSGAGLAMVMGLPDELVHIIAAHSKEGEFVKRIPEAVVIFHCDFIDFEICKAKQGL